MKVELGKTYRTRDGREVRIYAVDGGGELPVHGAYRDAPGRWVIKQWLANGQDYDEEDAEGALDLIEVKPRIRREVWVNVFEGIRGDELNGSLHFHFTKEKADADNGPPRRLACIPLTVDCEEGEGL